MRAGRLRDRVDFLKPTKVDDERGGYRTDLVTIALNVPAEVKGITGSEAVREKVLRGIRVFEITTRYRSDIDPTCQVRFGSIDLNVRSAIDEQGKRRELVILADSETAVKSVG